MEIRDELLRVVEEMDRCIAAVCEMNARDALEWPDWPNAYSMVDRNGQPVLAPLLIAKANALITLERT